MMERRAPWTVRGLDHPVPLSPDFGEALDGMIEADARAEAMIDPAWTPARGYGHASALLESLARTDADRVPTTEGR